MTVKYAQYNNINNFASNLSFINYIAFTFNSEGPTIKFTKEYTCLMTMKGNEDSLHPDTIEYLEKNDIKITFHDYGYISFEIPLPKNMEE